MAYQPRLADPNGVTPESLVHNPKRPPGFKPIKQKTGVYSAKKKAKFGPPETLAQASKHLECHKLKEKLKNETIEVKKEKLRKKIKSKGC
jgi:hypothetical protein